MSLELDFLAILSGKDGPLRKKAIEFQQFTQQLIASPSGQQWFQTLCAFAGHPMSHYPGQDAHSHGRCEVTAFLLRLGSDTAIPTLPQIRTTTQTERTNGKHKQRRKTAP